MKYLISEEEAAYQTLYQGHFSRKLASWAISNMQLEDVATKDMKPVTIRPFDDVMEVLKANGVSIQEESRYDAWYLFMMSIADYTKSLPTDKMRATYVEETIFDPDGESTNVLACFVAKMCNKGIPIMWDLFV
jgi:hypothetical protein